MMISCHLTRSGIRRPNLSMNIIFAPGVRALHSLRRLACEKLVVDRTSRRAYLGDAEIPPTPKAFAILEYMIGKHFVETAFRHLHRSKPPNSIHKGPRGIVSSHSRQQNEHLVWHERQAACFVRVAQKIFVIPREM